MKQNRMFDDIIEDVDKIDPRKLRPVNHVVFVLDHSGSMHNISKQSMDNFNEQLQTLKKESHDQETLVTLTKFSDKVDIVYSDKHIDDVKELTEYEADGMTALYDAIALSINNIREKVIKEENHSALMIIITDGYENRSSDYKGEDGRKKIKSMIEEFEGNGNWTFVFLGANIDVEEVATTGMSFSAANTVCFASCDTGVKDVGVTTTSGIGSYYTMRRSGGQATNDFFSDPIKESTDAKDVIQTVISCSNEEEEDGSET